MQTLAWTLVLLLALSVALLVRWARRRDAGHRRRAEHASVAHARELAELGRSAATRRTEVHRVLEREIAARSDEAASAIRLLEEERDQALAALARTWDSEVVSHRMIADACAAAGLDGVLASDVVVVPEDTAPGRRHLAQVDHVLLTSHGALIIEAKHWRGLVLDGVLPETVHPALGVLVPGKDLIPPFAVQVTRGECRCTSGTDALETLVVRRHLGADSPVAQVRRQAGRLVDHVERRIGCRPWLETYVLYSHARASVRVEPEHRTSPRVVTRVLAGHADLVAAMTAVARSPKGRLSPARVGELRDVLAAAGAHVEAVGPRADRLGYAGDPVPGARSARREQKEPRTP